MASANKTIAKLQKTAKSKYAELKEKAKEELKARKHELEAEVRSRLPTEEEIKARFIEEIQTRGIPIACSLKAQDLAEKAYFKFKDFTGLLNTKAGGIQGKVASIIEYAANIEILIAMIETFTDLLTPITDLLIDIRNLLTKAIKVIEKLDLNPLSVGLIILMYIIQQGIDICTEIGLLIGNALNAVVKFINWIRKKVAMITGMLGQILVAIIKIVAFIKMIDLMVEAAYMMYLNICNAYPEDNAEDHADSSLLDDFIEDPNLAEEYLNDAILNLQNMGKDEIIVKYNNANFEQIGYSRFKPGTDYLKQGTEVRSSKQSSTSTRSGTKGFSMGRSDAGGSSGGGTSGGGGGGTSGGGASGGGGGGGY